MPSRDVQFPFGNDQLRRCLRGEPEQLPLPFEHPDRRPIRTDLPQGTGEHDPTGTGGEEDDVPAQLFGGQVQRLTRMGAVTVFDEFTEGDQLAPQSGDHGCLIVGGDGLGTPVGDAQSGLHGRLHLVHEGTDDLTAQVAVGQPGGERRLEEEEGGVGEDLIGGGRFERVSHPWEASSTTA